MSFWAGGFWRAVKRRLQDNAAAVASLTVERGGGSWRAVKRRVQDCAAAVASLTVEPTTGEHTGCGAMAAAALAVARAALKLNSPKTS